MSLTTLRFTQFKVQRLQCIGGHGRAAPYRITTYNGPEIGSFGDVMEFTVEASNAAIFEGPGLHGLKRLLGMFRH
jgi:hypothetical protein